MQTRRYSIRSDNLSGIEVLHGGHVACQEQFNVIPMGQNVHSNANIFIVPGMQHGRRAKPLLRLHLTNESYE